MSDSKKLLEHFESENRESVEPVEEGLRAQVAAGECVALRGELHGCIQVIGSYCFTGKTWAEYGCFP